MLWNAGQFGVVLTFSIFLATVIYRLGGIHARVEALESWRERMRDDMHEISDKLEGIGTELRSLHTLVQERTDRRIVGEHCHYPRVQGVDRRPGPEGEG